MATKAKKGPRPTLVAARAKTAYGLLSHVRRLILDDPRRYNQSVYIHRTRQTTIWAPSGAPACGTVGCVAGWVATLVRGKQARDGSADATASHTLGLKEEQAEELFTSYVISRALQPGTAKYARAGAAHVAKFQKRYQTQLRAKRVGGR